MTAPRKTLPAADDDLWALVAALVDGIATPAERDRLERRLRAEPPSREFYVTYLDLHAQLQWRTRGESARPAAAESPARSHGVAPSRYRAVAAACLAVAAALLAAVLIQRPRSDDGEVPDFPDAPAGSVAVLIDSPQTVWDKETTLPTETGARLLPGRLKLKAGVVAVAFHGGGEVLLEGPADFDIRAADSAFLRQGKLTATVPEGAPAFRVGMPGVEVTDRGGECGLLRDDAGVTEVHVFAGRVEADATGREGPASPGVRLDEQAGARVDAVRRALTPVPLNEGAFARLRPEVRVIDTTVRDGDFAGRNFGTAPRVAVKNSIPGYTSETYLRFDLAGVKGKVSEAKVRLVPVRVGMKLENAAALVSDNQWGETTLTWDTKPPSGLAFATWIAEEGRLVEFDVTRFVQEALAGDRMLSLRIFAPQMRRGNSIVVYGSRRGDAEARPQLLVTVVP
jgi:ferric-dicitrate binding protein FerR (iron transport regulator)